MNVDSVNLTESIFVSIPGPAGKPSFNQHLISFHSFGTLIALSISAANAGNLAAG
jgi:hypothetical protein